MRSHEIVLDWVEQQLARGELLLGDRLPGERALAEELGISRAAVREGLRVLEVLGVLRSGVGSGPSAGTVVVSEPALALGAALRLHLATQHLSAADVMETRVVLEGWAAAHVRADAPELDEAERLLAEMQDSSLPTADFLDRDAAFHVVLARATGNPLVGAMMASIRESIRGYTLALTSSHSDWPTMAGRLRSEHRDVLAALRDGRSADAARLLTEHIEGYYRDSAPPGSAVRR